MDARKNNRKILIVVTSMGIGGLETYIVNFLSSIVKKKCAITIVFTNKKDNWYKKELEELGVKTLFCPNGYSQVSYVYRIYKIIRELKINVVCDFRNDFAAPTLLAAKMAGVGSRVAMYRNTRKGFSPTLLKNIYSNIIHQFTKHLATKIIGNTSKVLDAFYPNRKENDGKYAVVNNGVDLNKFSPNISGQSVRNELGISADSIVVGHVGRFHPQKNHIMMLKTFADLIKKTGNIHLLFVGEGPLRDEIERTVVELKISEKVTLVGNRRDIPELLASMDIFFFPSLNEGLPNALIEAMSCGLPIVASNIKEIKEILPSELYCQLYDCNDINGFICALKKLCSDECERNKLGDCGRAWVVKNFTIEASAENLYRQLFTNVN